MNTHELYHDVFGSVLDRRDMTPYLLRNCTSYAAALARTDRMLANRGFDRDQETLLPGELLRAASYVSSALQYYAGYLLPLVAEHLASLEKLGGPARETYRTAVETITKIRTLLESPEFRGFVMEDPRHLFLLVSLRRYPDLFKGYRDSTFSPPPEWLHAACSLLKMAHIIKAIEGDSQDIHEFAQLAFFFSGHGQRLTNLYSMNWRNPVLVPEEESARRAFVKIASFFRKLTESVYRDPKRGSLVFDSGDGVLVDILEIKARLKSPESMFAKLGKDIEGESYDIRDILAITFLLRHRDDTLCLFHALQKRGVILQENTVSTSITQTLFKNPSEMTGAVQKLLAAIAAAEGRPIETDTVEIEHGAQEFFRALGKNAAQNPHSSEDHRKFQCKINYSLPVHRDITTNRILVPGTLEWDRRSGQHIETRQHTLPVELRISDVRSWEQSEKKGEAHHAAYKARQLIVLMNRLLDPVWSFPEDQFGQLRADQGILFR